MSNFEKARAAIIDRFIDEWEPGDPVVPPIALARIEMPNVKFARPDTGAWGRLTIAHASREAVAIGAGRVRLTGILFFQVFVPEGSGTKLLMDCVDAFAAIFDNATFALLDASGHIRCEFVNANSALVADGFLQQTFRVTWQTDQNL